MFDNNPGGLRLFVIQLVFLILSWIFALLRGWVKIFLIKKVTLDDCLMFAATVSNSLLHDYHSPFEPPKRHWLRYF